MTSMLKRVISLSHLLAECHQGFLMSRSTLLHPIIAHQVKQLQHEHVKEHMSSADLITFVPSFEPTLTANATLMKET